MGPVPWPTSFLIDRVDELARLLFDRRCVSDDVDFVVDLMPSAMVVVLD